MLIDCATCPVAGAACEDCSVGVLLTLHQHTTLVPAVLSVRSIAALDVVERRAVAAFVAAGLVHPTEAAALVARVDDAAPVAV
ncbi:MAG: hypothetical protein ABI746_04390 [Dermatophilaceae bacterium]